MPVQVWSASQMANKNFPESFPLEEIQERMMLEPADGFLAVAQIDDVQETASGIILAQDQNLGVRRGVVLAVGRLQATRNRAEDFVTYKPGDVVYWSAKTALGVYDPGLDGNIGIIGYPNLLARVPRERWLNDTDAGDTDAGA